MAPAAAITVDLPHAIIAPQDEEGSLKPKSGSGRPSARGIAHFLAHRLLREMKHEPVSKIHVLAASHERTASGWHLCPRRALVLAHDRHPQLPELQHSGAF